MRSYRVTRRRTASGERRWAVEASCIDCACYCEHWVLLPWRWASPALAEAWVARVETTQSALLAAGLP